MTSCSGSRPASRPARRPRRVLGIVLACGASAWGCARGAATGGAAASAPTRGPVAFASAAAPLPRFHSKSFSLSLPLPDGPSWRIDDHRSQALVATHAPTRSKIAVAVLHADELVGRARCEGLARQWGLVPGGDLRTVEDDVELLQSTFDTRVWVAVDADAGPGRALVGYVMAFGGHLRKCLAFVYSTEVDSAADASVLSSRLAFARERILGGLRIDSFDAIGRESPAEAGPGPER